MEGDAALRALGVDAGAQWATGEATTKINMEMSVQAAVQPPTSVVQQEAEDDQLMDSGRNWSPEVLLELVKIWRREHCAHPELSRAQRMQTVYDSFQQTVDCSHRSRKAVDDKLYSMKQMYQFIVKMNSHFREGGAGTRKTAPSGLRSWFELTKEERRSVRSLHRVRIPNISREVFDVFDNVLGSDPSASQSTDDINGTLAESSATTAVAVGAASTAASENGNNGRAQSGAALPATAAATTTAPTPMPTYAPSDDPPEVVDIKRNWSYEVTCQLAKVWNSVHREHSELRGATLSLHVYKAFMAAVGGSSRSRKAVDDKMHSMKEMYRFIKAYETSRLAGEPKTPWYDLTKPERRAVRAENKIRVPNLAPFVYNEIDMLMTRMNQDSSTSAAAGTDAAGEASPSVAAAPAAEQESASSLRQVSAASSAEPTMTSSASTTQSSNGNDSLQPGGNGTRKTTEVVPVESRATASLASPARAEQQTNGGLRRAWEPSDASAFAPTSQTSDPSETKRQRTTAAQDGVSEPAATPTLVDAHTARTFMEQMRLVLAQDREERQQQHTEQMAALREIAELLRQKR